MIGKILGNRYEILELIGSGGMANVYKAHCKLLNRPVAIKVLKKELVQDKEYLKRFNTEAQAAASIVHPNIVSIFDFGNEQDLQYIVMELIDGITLKQYINENAPLDLKDALNIANQICDAIAVAHEHNIVHRDIKPHNIMITGDSRVKVTDFGIARAVNGFTMTADKSILGSVHYISPEQARGNPVDGKTDLYSLGVVLYEMLTGRVPFDSDSPVAVAMKHIEETPVNPREYNPAITYSVQSLMLKAISKDIKDRYQSADEFKQDISKLLANPDSVIETNANNLSDDNSFDKTMKIPVVGTLNKNDEKLKSNDNDDKFDDAGDLFFKENRKILVGAIVTALLIVGLFSLGVTYIIYPEAPIFSIFAGDSVKVPNFVGLKIDEANKLAKENGLNIEIKEEIVDETVPEGCIISQTPKARRKADIDSIVYVTISVGSEKLIVEDYRLTNYDNAKRAIVAKGFTVEKEYEFSDEVPENYVIRHTPEEGAEAPAGSPITLFVSKGPEETTVTVPNFVGKTLDQAKTIIEKEGLVVGDVSYEKSVIDEGIVIKQNIAGGETVGNNTPINLVVSIGNKNNSVNEVTEQTLRYVFTTEKEEVTIRITEDGTTIYDGLAFPSNSDVFTLKVKGTGQKYYEIYVDGVLEETQTISFN